MAYHALYRKYRPSSFSEVIGQEHITTILKNQVKSGRVTHAYLFSGSRGTGKTSTARIFAKVINCLDPRDGEPCGECEACKLNVTDSIDIIEMDAASNSRVDEMRSLLDKAEFAPIYLKTKVYIIDEAHMLSKSANNALLKTLEEPPAHVVFILATTEPQALPSTILSRCQRFDFRRPSVMEMVGLLKRIMDDIGAHIDEDGLTCIARAADGGVRDCLSIADQCLSFIGNELTLDDVLGVLGSMNTDFLFDFADAIIRSDMASVFKKVDEVVASGRDIGIFVQDLADHFRSLLLTKVCGNCTDILDCTSDMMKMYQSQADTVSRERIERALNEIMLLQPNLKWVTMPRILLESTLMKICHPDEQTEIIALADRLSELEKMIREGTLVVSEASKKDEPNEVSVKDEEADKEADKEAHKPVQEVNTVFEVPAPSKQAEELYKKFMSALMAADIMLGIQLQLAVAHWCDEENLYICFDKAKRSNYNYANGADIRQKLRRVAAESIAPFNIELVLKDGSVTAAEAMPTELFGVEITEED